MSIDTAQQSIKSFKYDKSKHLTVSKVALILGVSTTTVRNYGEDNKLQSTRLENGYRIYNIEDVTNFKKILDKERKEKKDEAEKIKREKREKHKTNNQLGTKPTPKNVTTSANTKQRKNTKRKNKALRSMLLLLLLLSVSGLGISKYDKGKQAEESTPQQGYVKSSQDLAYGVLGPSTGDVLAIRAPNSEYGLFTHLITNFLEDATFQQNVTVEEDLTVEGISYLNGTVQTPTINFTGNGTINQLDEIDEVTEDTLEQALDINGDVVSVDDNGLTLVRLANTIDYGGDFTSSGTFTFDGTVELNGGEITATADELNQLAGLSSDEGGLYFSDGSELTQDNENLVWDSSTTSLGIGTNSPTSTLDVEGTITADGLILPTGAVPGYILSTDGNGVTSWVPAANTSQWTLNGGELYTNDITTNVGIGNSSPTEALDVTGNIAVSGDLILSGISSGTDNSVLVLDTSNQIVTDEIDSRVWGTSLLDGNGTSNYLSKYSDTDTLTTSVIYDDGTNVGIGTTSPTAFLDLPAATTSESSLRIRTGVSPTTPNVGDIYADGNDLFYYNGAWVDLTAGASGGGGAEFVDAGSYLHPADSSGSEDLVIGATTIGAADIYLTSTGGAIFNKQGNSVDFVIEGSSDEALFFADGSGDNIGIGTTNPQYKLDVNGSVNLTSLYIGGSQVTADATELNLLDGRSGTLLDSANAGSFATTGVTAGDGLTGGGTTGVITIDIGAGSGIIVNADSIESILGTDIDSSEIANGTILPVDLDVGPSSPNDNEVLTYDTASGEFRWDSVSGAGAVDTSGTTANYIPLLQDSNTLTNSSLYENGSNQIGIGTTNPNDTLDVDGSIDITSGNTYQINDTDVLSSTTLGSSVVNSSLTSTGALNSGSISSGFGNIDIGSSNLDADGTVTFGGLSTDGLVTVSSGTLGSTATIGSSYITDDAIVEADLNLTTHATGSEDNYLLSYDNVSGGFTWVDPTSVGPTSLWTDGGTTTYLTATSDNLGIGTTSAAYKLDVSGDIRSTGDLRVDGDDIFLTTNTSGFILVADGTNYNPVDVSGDIDISSSGVVTIQPNSVTLGTDTTGDYVESITAGDGLTGTTSGEGSTPTLNVGAGSGIIVNADSIESILGTDIDSSEIANGTILPVDLDVGPSSPNDNEVLTYDTASGEFRWDSVSGAGAVDTSGTTANYIPLLQDSNTLTNSSLYENGSNQIGIGTTNPNDTLDVDGSIDITSGNTYQINDTDVLSSTTLGSSVVNSSLTSTGALNSGSISSGFGNIDIGSSNLDADGTVTFGGLSTDGLVTVSSGTLGSTATIGSSYITDDAIVEADLNLTTHATGSEDNYLLSYDNVSGGFTWVDPTSVGPTSLWTDGGTTTYLTSTSDNLGIGTTSAAYKLDVSGDIRSTGDLRVDGDDIFLTTNTSGFILVADGTNYNPVDVSGDIDISSSGVVTIQPNSVTLGTDTTGDYVESITAGDGLTGTTSGEGSTPTLNVGAGSGITANADTIELGPLTSDWNQTGAFDIILNNSSSELLILDSDGTHTATLDVGNLSVDTTFTLSGAGGDLLTQNNASSLLSSWDQNASDDLTTSTNFSGDVSGLYNNLQIGTTTVGTNELASDSVNSSKIIDDTIAEADLDLTNSPTPGYVLSYDSGGGFTWVVNAGSGSSKWSEPSTTTYLTNLTNDLAVGGTGPETANLFFDESVSALRLNPFGTSSGNTAEVRFTELLANGTNYTGFKAPDSLAGNVIYTLPTADATTANQVLASDSSGNLSWIDVSSGSGSYSGWTLVGDTGPSQSISSGNTVTIAGGTNISTETSATDTITVNLDDSITLAGDVAVNGGDITSTAGTLIINAGGSLDLQDDVTVDSLTTDTGGVDIASGQDLRIGLIYLSSNSAPASGASLVGLYDNSLDNISSNTTVQGAIGELDSAIGNRTYSESNYVTSGEDLTTSLDSLDQELADIASGATGLWTDTTPSSGSGVVYLTELTDDFAIGGTDPTSAVFGIDESTSSFYFGADNSANPTLNFEATDGDSASIGFNTNDTIYVEGGNVGIGSTNASQIFTVGPSNELTIDSSGNFSTSGTVATSSTVSIGSVSTIADNNTILTVDGSDVVSSINTTNWDKDTGNDLTTSTNFSGDVSGLYNNLQIGTTTVGTNELASDSVNSSKIIDDTIAEADLNLTTHATGSEDNYLLSYDNASGGFTWVDPTSVGPTSLWTDGGTTTYLTATSDNLGIGTTSAAYKLDVSGDIRSTGDLRVDGDDIFLTTNTSGFILVADGTNYNPVDVSGDIDISSSGVVTIQPNSVTLGTDTTGDYVESITAGDGLTGTTSGEGSTPTLNVGAGSGIIVNADSIESVLGTDIDTSEIANGTILPVDLDVGPSSPNDNEVLTYDTASGEFRWDSVSGAGAVDTSGTTANYIPLLQDSNTLTNSSLYENGSNQIGIGTTNPNDTLDVDGSIDITSGNTYQINDTDVLSSTTLGSSVVNSSLTSTGALNSGSISSGFGNIDIGSSNLDADGTVTFGGLSTDGLVTVSSGTLGSTATIGSSYITDDAIVEADLNLTTHATGSEDNYLLSYDNVSGGFTWVDPTSVGPTSLWTDGGTTTYLTSTSDNLGIGTTSAAYKLDVSGDIRSTGDLRVDGDDIFLTTNTSGFILVADGTNYNPVDVSGDIDISSSGVVTIQPNSVTLGTDTTGDYVESITAGDGLTGTTSGEGSTPTLNVGAGSGIIVNADSIESILGTDIDSSEIANGTILPVDLDVGPSSPNDNEVLTYDTASGEFRWDSVSGAGAVDTSGTTANYIPLLQDSNTLTNSSLYENGSNQIGIGTTNPNDTLDVDGSIDITSGNTYQINDTDVLSSTTLGSSVVNSSLTSTGALNSGSISSGFGNIDIGSSNLDADGTVTFGGLSTDGLVTVSSGTLGSTATIGSSYITDDAIVEADLNLTTHATGSEDNYLLSYDNVSGGFTWVDPTSVGPTSLWTDGGTTTYLTSTSDNLGIGTTSAAYKLDVSGDIRSTGDLRVDGDDIFLTTNTSGFILVADGTNYNPVDVSGDIDISSSGVVTIQPNSVTLGTDTTGDYVESITAGDGLTGTTSGEGSTPTLNVGAGSGITANADTIELGPLTSDWNQTGAFDIILNNSSSELLILDSDGTHTATLDVGNLSVDTTFTLSGAGGDLLTQNNASSLLSSWDQNASDDLTTSTNFSGDVSGLYNNLQIGTTTVGTNELASDSVNSSKIIDDTIAEADLDLTNSPTPGYVLSYDSGGGFTWVVNAGSGSSKWSEPSTTTYLTNLTNDLAVGGTGPETANLFFDESVSALRLNPFGTSSGNTAEVRFTELLANGTNYTGFKAPDSLAGNVIYTLPTADATTANQVLASDSSGNLSWIDVSSGSGSYSGWTLVGDTGPSQSISSGNTVTIAGGTNISTETSATDTITVNLDDSITLAGDVAVNGGDITSTAGTLIINAGGSLDLQDDVTVDSLTTDTGGVDIASGQDLRIGLIYLSSNSAPASGASLVGLYDNSLDNISSNTTVQGAIGELDSAIGNRTYSESNYVTSGEDLTTSLDSLDQELADIASGATGLWTDTTPSSGSGVVYLTELTDDFAIGGTDPTSAVFGIDESTSSFYFGADNSANPTLNFEATDGDSASIGFNTNDTIYVEGGNVGIGSTNASQIFTVGPSNELTIDSSGNFSTSGTVATSSTVSIGSVSTIADNNTILTVDGSDVVSSINTTNWDKDTGNDLTTSTNFSGDVSGLYNNLQIGTTTVGTNELASDSVNSSKIIDDTIAEADLNLTTHATGSEDNYLLSYDNASGGFTWVDPTSVGPTSLWTDGGTTTYLTATSDNLGIGTTSAAYKLDVSGDIRSTGDLRVDGDDIFLTTNTSGFILVADGTNYNPVDVSGDIDISSSGVVTIQPNSVTLGTDTTGDYVESITAGDGLTGTTSGEGSTPTLNVGAGSGIIVNADSIESVLGTDIDTSEIANGTILPVDLDVGPSSPNDNEVLTYDTASGEFRWDSVSGAGAVDTSGTTANYIPLLQDSNTLTNSSLYENGSNQIGIGTTNPNDTLDVDGSIDITSGNTYQINDTDVLSSTTLGSSVVNSSLTSTGALNSGSISSGFGNIDIGSSNLDADGTVTFGGLSTDGLVTVSSGTLGSTATIGSSYITPDSLNYSEFSDSLVVDANTSTDLYSGTSDVDLRFFNSDSLDELLFLDGSTGNIGIGNTLPTYKLDISGVTQSSSGFRTNSETVTDFTGNGITLSSGALTVDETYNFSWSGTHDYSATDINFTNATSTTLDTTGDLILDADGGDLTLADGGVTFATLTNSTTDLTLDIAGGDLIFANNDVLNIGGSGSDTAYNVIGDSVAGASSNVNSDDDLYIEGNLEVDGTIYDVNGNILQAYWSETSGVLHPITLSNNLAIGGTGLSDSGFYVDNLGNTTLADGALLDLSNITHDDTAPQGLLLPQNTTLANPSSGEGYLAWDTDGILNVYDGTAWLPITTGSSALSLQTAYEGGSEINLSATYGDIRLYNDSGSEMLFLDESTGYLGIGTTAPTEQLALAGGNFLLTPGDPTTAGNWDPNDTNVMNNAISVYVSGKYAYVTGSTSDNLAIVDISDPTSPTTVGNWDPNDTNVMNNAISVYVSGKYAYVAGWSSDNLAIVDISDPSTPTTVGNWDPNDLNVMNAAQSVYVSGKYAYVAGWSSDNLAIVDISDPTSPTTVGNWDPNDGNVMDGAYSVYVSGKYAYVAGSVSDNLAIVDISDPTSPTTAGNWDPNDTNVMEAAYSVYVSGKYAYVAGLSSDNLAIVDISDPSTPTTVGNWDPNDTNVMDVAISVYVSGKYAYVAGESSDNLVIVDISDPSTPTTVGNWDPNDGNVMDSARSVYVSGKYAYVAGSTSDNLAIVDINGIDAPAATIGDLATGTLDVWENANIFNDLYVGNGLNVGSGGIYSQSDITLNSGNFLLTPGDPTTAGNWDPNDTNVMYGATSVYVSGKYAYVGGEFSNNLAIVDISDPTSPTTVGNWDPNDTNVMDDARSVYVSGKYAYVTGYTSDNLAIVDISDPSTPTTVGNWDPNDTNVMNAATSVYVSGKYAYVTSYTSDNLAIVDISDPSTPTTVGNWDPNDTNVMSGPQSVYVSGKYAYVAGYSSNNLAIVDISDPSTPTTVGNWDPNDLDVMNAAKSVYISGKYAYVAGLGSNNLAIVDISDPSTPTTAGNWDPNDTNVMNGAFSVYVSGKYAYMTGNLSDNLAIVDISDPTSPTTAGNWDPNDTNVMYDAQSVYVSGKYAYVAGLSSDNLAIVDINGIDAPAATIGDLATGTLDVWENANIFNDLYVGNGLNVGSGGIYSSGEIAVAGNVEPATNNTYDLGTGSIARTTTMNQDLSAADASFWGEDASDLSGRAISKVGDVNGDGYDDFIIGASGDDDGGDAAGQTYLIFGSVTGWAMDTDLSTADASFWGEDLSDNSGDTVSGVGDVNGDGYDDFIIGAYQDDDGGSNAGQTYLILGKASGWAMDTDLSAADASFWGEDADDQSGFDVSGVGDVNGDGYDDFVIGAKEDDDGGSNAGQTYLILGKASGWAMDTDLSAADASFWGEDADDLSGTAVSGVGDVNGDGYDDFIIGAYGDEDGGLAAGQTYLILGKASGWAMDTDLSTADASFWGEDASDYSGWSLSDAGDVNADGYDDFIIGAYGSADGGLDAGQTYLILGKASGWAMDTDLSAADASFWGEDASDYSAERDSLSSAGDINGDGYDDFVIGAYGDDDGGSNAGQTYIILGKASGWAMDTDLSAADASFLGESSLDFSGYAVSGAGDVNGDGYDDFVIGAYGDDDGGDSAGQTYLILSDPRQWDNVFARHFKAGESLDIGTDLSINGTTIKSIGNLTLDTYQLNLTGTISATGLGDNYFAGNVGIGTTAPTEQLALAGGNFLLTPGDPTTAGNWDPNDTNVMDDARSVYVSGKYAYVAGSTSDNLAIVDISDPTSPTTVGNWDPNDTNVMNNAISVYVSGKYAYVAGSTSDNLAIVDISDPSTPTTVGNWDPNDLNVMNATQSVYVSGKYAYVAGWSSDNLAIVDISDPTSPTTAGNWDPNDTNVMNGAISVYVSGKYAYVAGSGSDNLAIVDISDPSTPTTVGNWDPNDTNVMNNAISVYISGKYAYVAGNLSGNLAIVDISDPTSPTTAGNWDPNDTNVMDVAQFVYVSGKYAYVAGWSSDNLAIVDISDPSTPTTVGNWDPNDGNVMDSARSVYVSGKYAYVAGSTSDNLAIVDINGIDAPAATIGDLATGTLDVWENANIFNDLYVGNGLNVGSGGIYSQSDITLNSGNFLLTPGDPTTAGNWDPNNVNVMDAAHSVYISGKYAYVAGYDSDNLAIVDISDPTTPTTVGNWDPNDTNVMDGATSVYVSGKYAYVTGYTSDNLAIVDISDPTSPSTVGNWDPNDTNVMSGATSVYVSGKYAYVAGESSDNLAIVDISDPTSPTTVGNWDPNDTNVMEAAYSVYVSGQYAYVTGYLSDNLAIVDISDPTTPTTVGNWDPNDTNVMDVAISVYVSGKYAYVAGYFSDNLAIVDISDPSTPTTVGNWDPNDTNVMDAAYSVYVSGKYAYVAGESSDNLVIVDISDPSTPTTAGNWDPNDTNVMDSARSVYVSGKYAYVGGWFSDNLAIVDINGIDAPAATIGDLATGTLDVWENANIFNDLYVGNGLNVGSGGIYSDGRISTNLLDLSTVDHGSTAPQGLLLPQNTTLANPSSGEGYLAWDTDNDELQVFDGTSWSSVGESPTLQLAYEGGNTVNLSSTEGDVRFYNDSGSEMLFLDESTGNIGIGITVPGSLLNISSNSATASVLNINADALTTGTGSTFSFDALTTGTGMLIESAPGSATTLSGDLFRLNVGANSTVTGNIMSIEDNGSALFTVDQTQITSALPHQFTAAGDVSMAYDLNFTNQTASYIKSKAPLYIEAGESFENNDLTFTTYGTGSAVFDLAQGSLDIDSSVASGFAVNIVNHDKGTQADGVKIQLGPDTSPGGNNEFIMFYDGDGSILGAVEGDGSGGVTNASAGADYAELFYGNRDNVEPSSILCLNENGEVQHATRGCYILGAYSVQPNTLGNWFDGWQADKDFVPVGLLGQIKVKVKTSNGLIQPGDAIAVSNVAGVGEKALSAGPIVGRAMEGYINNDPDNVGEIKVLVQPGWYDPVSSIDAYGNLAQNDVDSLNFDAVLDQISTLNIGEWTFTGDTNVEHIGPTAREFHETFGFSKDQDVTTADIAGIALAGVKGLVNKVDNLEQYDVEMTAAATDLDIRLNEYDDKIQQLDSEVLGLRDDLAVINELLQETNGSTESTESTESTQAIDTENILAQIINSFDEIKDFIAALGMQVTFDEELGKDVLAFNNDVNFAGDVTLYNVQVVGDLGIGMINVDSLNNSINYNGAECYNKITQAHNTELCDAQSIRLQSNLAGNVDFFEGEIVFSPDGTISAETVETQVLSANEIRIPTESETVGTATIAAGTSEVVINSTLVQDSSKIFATPRGTTNNQTLYVSSVLSRQSFAVSVDTTTPVDILFDWWVVN